jgi:putative DNA primase/helicase
MQERQQAAAEKAQRLWRDARRADPDHGYLRLKRLAPMALRQRGSELLVPLFLDGALVNLQMITPDGGKRFLSGGRVKGAYAAIGRRENASQLYICEGWATGATLHQHTGQPVAAAMNAGNLLPVATALRERYGQTFELVIAGDDDRQTEGNPGRTAANAAALASGAKVVFPDWPEGALDHLSDFNDLAVWSARHE